MITFPWLVGKSLTPRLVPLQVHIMGTMSVLLDASAFGWLTPSISFVYVTVQLLNKVSSQLPNLACLSISQWLPSAAGLAVQQAGLVVSRYRWGRGRHLLVFWKCPLADGRSLGSCVVNSSFHRTEIVDRSVTNERAPNTVSTELKRESHNVAISSCM